MGGDDLQTWGGEQLLVDEDDGAGGSGGVGDLSACVGGDRGIGRYGSGGRMISM